MKITEAFIFKLKKILKEKNMSQYALHKATGVPQSTITTILKNKVKTVNLSTIYDICSGLNIEFSDFFNETYFKLENLTD